MTLTATLKEAYNQALYMLDAHGMRPMTAEMREGLEERGWKFDYNLTSVYMVSAFGEIPLSTTLIMAADGHVVTGDADPKAYRAFCKDRREVARQIHGMS